MRGQRKVTFGHPSKWGGTYVLSTSCSLFWPLPGLSGVKEASGSWVSLFVFRCQFSTLLCFWPMSKLLQFFVGVTFKEADWLTPSVVRLVSVDAVPAADRTGRIDATQLYECDWLHLCPARMLRLTLPVMKPFCYAIYLFCDLLRKMSRVYM